MAGGTRILVDGGGGGPVSEVAGKESVAIHVQCYRDVKELETQERPWLLVQQNFRSVGRRSQGTV